MEQLKVHLSSRNNLLMWVALLAIALIAGVIFKVSLESIVLLGLVLACPLLHIWMIKDEKHKH